MSESSTAPAREYLRRNEAAEFLAVSPALLRKLARLGTGPAYAKIGTAVLYRVEDLRAWVAAQVKKAA